MSVLRGRRALAASVALGAAVAALQGAAAPRSASAYCELQVVYLGAPYLNAAAMSATDLGNDLGPGTIPACDSPGGGLPGQQQVVTLARLRGVAPRFAVALRASPDGAYLLIANGVPCRLGSATRSLACLRERTARLVAGPALITYPSAPAGAVIRLGVHVRDPLLRQEVVFGIDTLLQRREGKRWVSIYHLPYPLSGQTPPPPVPVGANYVIPSVGFFGGAPRPVQLPLVAPGQYRIAKDVSIGSRRRRLLATLTILPPPPPPCVDCSHG